MISTLTTLSICVHRVVLLPLLTAKVMMSFLLVSYLIAEISILASCMLIEKCVCLFVSMSYHISRTKYQIINKIGHSKVHDHVSYEIVGGKWDLETLLQSKERICISKIFISQPIAMLQRQNRNWNIALPLLHSFVVVNFRYHPQSKMPRPKLQVILNLWNYSTWLAPMWYQIWKDHHNMMQKKVLYIDDFINHFTVKARSPAYVFL